MKSNKEIDALFQYAAEGIVVANAIGEIVRINPSAEDLFGYERDELIGQRIEVLVPNRFSGKHAGYREKYLVNPHARSMGTGMDLFGLKKDGMEFPVEISLSPYISGNTKFVIAFIVDITVRKQAEEKLRNYSIELEKQVKNRTVILEEAIEELEKTKKDLDKSLAKERELNELKSRFVSIASHEFRTPLTTINSSLSLITKLGDLNENQNKYVGKIKKSITNLTDILNDFLSVSKLEEGKVEPVPEAFNLAAFITDIKLELEGIAADHQVLQYTHAGEERVYMDKKMLKNILFNLISNALKFSPEGTPVSIASEVNQNTVKILIEDTGIGISKVDQEQLFERFFRGKNATYIQGTGLGLNIVARYTELMEGSIEVESELGQYTRFTLAFPNRSNSPTT